MEKEICRHYECKRRKKQNCIFLEMLYRMVERKVEVDGGHQGVDVTNLK